jgi:hypothetical protein
VQAMDRIYMIDIIRKGLLFRLILSILLILSINRSS